MFTKTQLIYTCSIYFVILNAVTRAAAVLCCIPTNVSELAEFLSVLSLEASCLN